MPGWPMKQPQFGNWLAKRGVQLAALLYIWQRWGLSLWQLILGFMAITQSQE